MIKRFLIPFSCCVFCAVQYIIRTCEGQTRQTGGGHGEKWRIQNWVSSKLFNDSYFLGCGTDTFWNSFFHYLVVLVTNVFCTVLSATSLSVHLVFIVSSWISHMYPSPTYLSTPSNLPSAHGTFPPRQNKIPKPEPTKQQQQKRRLSSRKL